MSAVFAPPGAGFAAAHLCVETRCAREFIDLTDWVVEQVSTSGVLDGLAVISSQHTTASIVVNECEPELMKDLEELLARLAPEGETYAHNAVPCGPNEQPNGHAHCQGLLLQASATVPITRGRLALGRYQRIFLVELDHARARRVNLMVMGTPG
jgi:secondary thiamine-phosphate synthase enzyme